VAFTYKFWRWFGSNATSSRYGAQDSTPATSVHIGTINTGVDGALQISTVWGCVALVCENIASLPLNVYVKDPKTGKRSKLDDSVRIQNVLHSMPNRHQTGMEFWMVMLLNFMFRGNAFARKFMDDKGDVMSLWPLSADQVEVEMLKNGDIIYRYWDGEQFIEYKADQIFHLRGMGNNTVGMSRLDYMQSSVGLSINAQNRTNKTVSNNGRRPGILYTGGHILKPDQRKETKEKFNKILTDTENELYLLEGEFKFDPLGMTAADIQLLETRKFSVQDLARWFGVPSILINDTQETTSLGSSVEQIIELFYKLKLRPLLELMEQAIQKRILTQEQRTQGMFVKFTLEALLRSNLKDRMEVGAQGAQNGILTRNEIREKEDLPPIEGGDILTAQSNLLPLDKLGTQTTTGGGVPPDTVRQ
jgi:HK97 family phage portal protein